MKLHKGQCRFTASNPLELAMPYYTVLRKGDPFVPTINEGYKDLCFKYINALKKLTGIVLDDFIIKQNYTNMGIWFGPILDLELCT